MAGKNACEQEAANYIRGRKEAGNDSDNQCVTMQIITNQSSYFHYSAGRGGGVRCHLRNEKITLKGRGSKKTLTAKD